MSEIVSNLTIISPTLNEEANIIQLLNVLTEEFPAAKIIIADDGSRDATQQIVKDYSNNNPFVSLLDRSDQLLKGITASVVDAVQLVETKYFAVIDADLQHPPAVLKQLCLLAEQGANVVSGVRAPYQENQGIHRIFVTRVATGLAKLYLKIFKQLSVSDPMSGFFLMEAKLAKDLIAQSVSRFEPTGYKIFFDLLKVSPKGINYQEVQYQFAFRTGGKSKLSPRHALVFLRGLLK